jgi:hypothetical protein
MKIAVTGEMRSGKDTVCEYIQVSTKFHFHKLYFARAIENIIRKYFPEALKDDKKPRELYQKIGQFMRSIDPNVWVKQLEQDYDFYKEYGGEHFLVTDLRQPNEYEWLKKNGFTVIKVEADKEVRIKRMIDTGDNFNLKNLDHETELSVRSLPYDYLITNNTTLEDLYKQVDFVLNELAEKEKGVITWQLH